MVVRIGSAVAAISGTPSRQRAGVHGAPPDGLTHDVPAGSAVVTNGHLTSIGITT